MKQCIWVAWIYLETIPHSKQLVLLATTNFWVKSEVVQVWSEELTYNPKKKKSQSKYGAKAVIQF